MGKKGADRVHTKAALCIMLLILFTGAAVQAEEEEKSELRIYGEMDFEYSDNVFNLTDDQISIMDENDPDDTASGRYRGMDSLSDYILKPRIGIKWDSDSPFGGKFRLTSWLRYNHYLKNDDSDYTEGKLIIKNSAGERGSISLEGNFLYDFKKKNYLSDIVDINENGNISKDERTYTYAAYDEYEGIIDYRHELIKDKDQTISELYIKPFTGYSIRNYNSCFRNRDRDIIFGGVELDLEFINMIDLELSYRYESVSSPGNVELVLFDETVSGIDVNDDGSIRRNAPLYTGIDRSADRYIFEISPCVKLTKDIRIYLGYRKRTSKYTSGNPLDIEHYNQRTHREKYESGISYDLSKSWFLNAEYSKTKDEDPEDGIYKENNYKFTIKYKF